MARLVLCFVGVLCLCNGVAMVFFPSSKLGRALLDQTLTPFGVVLSAFLGHRRSMLMQGWLFILGAFILGVAALIAGD